VVRRLIDAIPDTDLNKAKFTRVVGQVLRDAMYHAPEERLRLWLEVREALMRHYPRSHELYAPLEAIFCDRPQRIEAVRATQSTMAGTESTVKIDTTSDTIKIEDVPVRRHTSTERSESLDLSSNVTPPVNQGLCGSCWAISTTQCLRDRANAQLTAPIPELSFQWVIDCSKHCISYRGRTGCALDCNGGFLTTAYKFLQNTGTPREGFHPNRHVNESGQDHVDGVKAKRRACPAKIASDEPLYKCDGFYICNLELDTFGITNARMRPQPKTPKQLRANADNIAEEIYLNGPVAVCYNLYSDMKEFWNHPKCGEMVYEIGWKLPKEERRKIDPVGDVRWTRTSGPHGIHFKTGHSVSIVGYGTQKDADGEPVDYWICRNSWGRPSNTYNKGFFKIRRGVNASAIEGDVAAPEVSASSAGGMHLATMAYATACAAPSHRADPTVLSFLFIVALFLVLMLLFR
jgi:hypothetical protein